MSPLYNLFQGYFKDARCINSTNVRVRRQAVNFWENPGPTTLTHTVYETIGGKNLPKYLSNTL